MKKLFATMTVCLMMVALMSSCGDSNTPEAVASKAVECMMKKDFKGLVDLTALSDQEKAGVVQLLEEKGSKKLDQQGGIKSFEIVDQQIDEKDGTATVKVKYVYGNGDDDTDTMQLIKGEDGQWKLSTKK